MFSNKDKKKILKNYKEIIDDKKQCLNQPFTKVIEASRGMYIYPEPILRNKGKQALCTSIIESHQKGKHPIVHQDSLTAWGNEAAEQHGLEIRDILKMKPGEKMKVILMDRNVGDYLHGTKVGTKYDPRKKGFTYASYTHKEDLTGILDMYDIVVIHDPFQWEVNMKSINDWFWGPIPKNIKFNKLNPKIKVGWRGPAIRCTDTKHLPENVVHYGTWWDDYLPFRYHNFLKVNRK